MKLADVIRFGKNFKMDEAKRFAQHVVPEVVRPARVIWNQAIGGMFLILTLGALASGFSYYRQQNIVALGFAFIFGSVMAFFCLTSFLQARKIRRR